MSDFERLRVQAAAFNAAERQRLARKAHGELSSFYQAQATEAYGRAGSGGGTTFGATRSRTADEDAEDDFVERWNAWKLGDGEKPSNSETDAYTFKRGVEKLYPQIQRIAMVKFGMGSPMRAGEP